MPSTYMNLLSSLQSPGDAKAGMSPQIRALYKAALAKLGPKAKPLYHQSRDIDALVTEPKLSGMGDHEAHKPPAIYASDNLYDNGISTIGEGFSPTALLKELRSWGFGDKGGMARIVPKPDARIKAIDEKDLKSLNQKALERYTNRSDSLDIFNASEAAALHKKYGKVYQKTVERPFRDVDIVKLLNADSMPGLTEYLIRNPKAVSIFSDNKAWNSMLAGLTAGAALTAGTTDKAEAFPLSKLAKLKPLLEGIAPDTEKLALLKGHRARIGKADHEIVDVVKVDRKQMPYHVVWKNLETGERFQQSMSKDYIQPILAAKGTNNQIETFANAGYHQKKVMALKGLTRREALRENGSIPMDDFKSFREWNQMQVDKIHQFDPGLIKRYNYISPVDNPDFAKAKLYAPEIYAKWLQAHGYANIDAPGEIPTLLKGFKSSNTPFTPLAADPVKRTAVKREEVDDAELTRRLAEAWGKPKLTALERLAGFFKGD